MLYLLFLSSLPQNCCVDPLVSDVPLLMSVVQSCRRDAGQRHSNRSKHDHRSVSRHNSHQHKPSQRHRDGDRQRDKDRDRACSRDQSNPGQHAERYLQRQAAKAAGRRSEKKGDKSGKREGRDKEELPVVDGVILSPENVARAQQGRQVKNVKGQWVDSTGICLATTSVQVAWE